MSVRFIKEKNLFVINTKSTSYAFDIFEGERLRHIYYGKKTKCFEPLGPLPVTMAPSLPERDWMYSPDVTLNEISFFGYGDFHATSLRASNDGTGVTNFVYSSYKVTNGRPEIDGIPFARADKNTQTLDITMKDSLSGCVLHLYYTVFPDKDIITRYMKIQNKGKTSVKIEKCMSLELAFDNGSSYDMISYYGKHMDECNFQRVPLHHGIQSVFSRRGASSPQYNPFFAICSHKADEEKGDVYGFNLTYSGSFLTEVELDALDHAKVLTGLGSENFGYLLEAGESFSSPEAVMTYSAYGIGKMTRSFHDFVKNNIMPPESFDPHPVVLNTWEACFFDIDQDKLVAFAREAKKLGFDMLVMDDGWFGNRIDDNRALGDWYEDKRKFPDGLAAFARKVKAEGVQFGIWIEPEMVNPDSDLYRAHPEWAIQVKGREIHISRSQFVLDMANPEVLAYLKDIFSKTFDGVEIDYFKWDMNRHICDIGSLALPPEKQCQLEFDYMKGVYELFDWFREKYPNAVIENCSSGGGRYDLAMMAKSFQIWASDNTDPYDRTKIQASAIKAYPAMTMSCHVSNPHGSMKSLDYRYKVALGGMLGYELNILEMSEEIKAEIAKQIAEYKTIEHVIRLGDYYELASPLYNGYYAYCYVTDDNSEIVMTVIEKADCKPGKTKLLKVKRADVNATYIDARTGKQYSGADLKAGITVELLGERDHAELFCFKKA